MRSNRFILPAGVRVHGLASLAPPMAAERVADGWEAACGVRPVLGRTFTGPDMSGLRHRAAGWRRCPELASGRRSGARRAVWPVPPAEGWKGTLCRGPERVPGWSGTMHCGGGWAGREYGRSPRPDGRVRRRAAAMGAAWTRRPGESLPAVFPGRAERKAACRLLPDGAVTMERILEPHRGRTGGRCRAERFVLAVQDTTTLDYDGLSGTSGPGGPGGGGKGASGILARFGIAADAVGRPLGTFLADADLRQEEGKDSVRRVDGLDRAQGLANACPDTGVVNVRDREGGFRQPLPRAEGKGAELLVRASEGPRRRVATADGGGADLRERVPGTEPVGERRAGVPACGGPNRRKGRAAELTLRCAEVDLLPPKDRAGAAPVRMVAVSAREESPPRRPATAKGRKGTAPLHWMLPGSGGGAGPGTARGALRWYGLRWRIERFFHALRQGTRMEDRRLDHADDLRKCLASGAITAFRVRDLSLLARERPDDPATMHVTLQDVPALLALARRHGFRAPRGPPDLTVAGFAVLAAGLAGFHPPERQPLPGRRKLREGVKPLSFAVIAIQAMREWGAGRPEGDEDTDSGVID